MKNFDTTIIYTIKGKQTKPYYSNDTEKDILTTISIVRKRVLSLYPTAIIITIHCMELEDIPF